MELSTLAEAFIQRIIPMTISIESSILQERKNRLRFVNFAVNSLLIGCLRTPTVEWYARTLVNEIKIDAPPLRMLNRIEIREWE